MWYKRRRVWEKEERNERRENDKAKYKDTVKVVWGVSGR